MRRAFWTAWALIVSAAVLVALAPIVGPFMYLLSALTCIAAFTVTAPFIIPSKEARDDS